MSRARYFHATLVVLGLAGAVHLDWHVARPAVHHLSLGWRWHWLLAIPVFAVLWAATVLGNIGSFMRDVASAWMVTELSSSPTAVALIQTAATLPVFLLAIPAGVLSDILDRRRFLIGVQVLLAANTCNTTANSMTDYLSTSTPITVGTTGQRSFGSDARGTIYQNSAGTILAAAQMVAAPAAPVSILQ